MSITQIHSLSSYYSPNMNTGIGKDCYLLNSSMTLLVKSAIVIV